MTSSTLLIRLTQLRLLQGGEGEERGKGKRVKTEEKGDKGSDQGFSKGEIKGGGGRVDRIYLLPKYFAMHIWLNISFSEHTERRGERKKGGGLKKAGYLPPAFLL